MQVWAPLSAAALLVLLGGLGLAAYGVTALTLSDQRTAVRWCAAFVFLLWALVAVFHLLSRLGLFGVVSALVGSVLTWVGCLLGGFSAARLLGCDREQSVLAATAIVSIPAAAVFVDSSYVDNLELAGFLMGFVLLLECRRSFSWWSAFVALA